MPDLIKSDVLLDIINHVRKEGTELLLGLEQLLGPVGARTVMIVASCTAVVGVTRILDHVAIGEEAQVDSIHVMVCVVVPSRLLASENVTALRGSTRL